MDYFSLKKTSNLLSKHENTQATHSKIFFFIFCDILFTNVNLNAGSFKIALKPFFVLNKPLVNYAIVICTLRYF